MSSIFLFFLCVVAVLVVFCIVDSDVDDMIVRWPIGVERTE